jgi:hypothetical protein
MADADLVRRIRAGECAGADLRGANLRGVNLNRIDLRGADLRGVSFDGAYLLGSVWRRTRLHDNGVWNARPPLCAAGDWYAMVVAPHTVRIGCSTHTIEEWLGDVGEELADENDVPDHDRWHLRIWLEGLALRDVWPGWVPDESEEA